MARSAMTTDTPVPLADLQVRPVRETDRAAISAVAAQVWNGEDYLPRVFDSWLADQDGLFCAAALEGRVIGVAKLSLLARDHWWMEGLRVDVAYRRQGVGRVLHHYIVNYTQRYAPGVLRFSTASKNAAVQKMAAETGFRQVAALVPMGAGALSAPPDTDRARLACLQLADLPRIEDWLAHSPYYRAMGQALEDGWKLLPLTPERLRQRIGAGQVYGWLAAPGDRLAGLVMLNEPRTAQTENGPESRLYIGYLDTGPDEMAGLARTLCVLAREQGHARVSLKAAAVPKLVDALAEVGYTRTRDFDLLLFERALV